MSTYSESHPVSRRMESGWLRPDRDQKIVAAVTFVMFIIGMNQANWLGGAPILAVGTLLYAPVYGRGKGFRRSGVGTILGALERRKIRRSGGNVYSYNLRDTLLSFDSKDYASPEKRKKSAFPADVVTIRPKLPSGGQANPFSFIRDKTQDVDHVIAFLVADGGPKFINSSVAQRFLWDKVLTTALKRGVNTTQEDIELAMTVIARSADPSEAIDYAQTRYHRDFLEYEAGSIEEKVAQDGIEDAGLVYGSGGRYILGIAIRMVMPKQWRHKDLDELTVDQVTSTELWGVINTILGNLSGAVTNLRYPSLFELNELMYLLFNSEDLGPFYAQQRADLKAEVEGKLERFDDAITLRRGPFPGNVHLGFDYARVNKTFHASAALIEFENSDYAPGFLDSLFNQPFPFVFSHFVQTSSFRKGIRRTRRKAKRQSFWTGLLARTNRDLHLEDAEAEAEVEAEHFNLFKSKSRATLSRLQVTVQAPTYEQVQTNINLMIGSLSNHDILSVQILDEETQLAPLLAHVCLIDT